MSRKGWKSHLVVHYYKPDTKKGREGTRSALEKALILATYRSNGRKKKGGGKRKKK